MRRFRRKSTRNRCCKSSQFLAVGVTFPVAKLHRSALYITVSPCLAPMKRHAVPVEILALNKNHKSIKKTYFNKLGLDAEIKVCAHGDGCKPEAVIARKYFDCSHCLYRSADVLACSHLRKKQDLTRRNKVLPGISASNHKR